MFAFLASPAQLLVLGSLALLSLADLRARALPGIRIFFVTAVLFGMITEPWKVLAVLLVALWGMELATANFQPRFPRLLLIPALVHPAAWPVLLTAAGTRWNLIARGDLLAIGGVACLLDGFGPLLAFMGVLFWRRFWGKGQSKAVPALPGMLLGALASLCFGILS